MEKKVYLKLIPAFILILLLSAMVSIPTEAVMLVSKAEEVSIGKQVQKKVISEYGGLYNNPAMAARVQKIGAKVAAVSTRKDITYTYSVVNSNVINAFAAPGGPVMITKALVNLLTSDNELAFVLSHETGHVAAQHGREAINRQLIAQGVLGLVFGKSSGTVQQGVGITYTLYERGYSRTQEYQADSYGVKFMKAAGYNTDGAISALAKLGIKRSSGVNKYLATHPDIPDRIDRVAKMTATPDAKKQQLVQQATKKVKK